MKKRKLAYALAISVISLLTGCGSSGGGTPPLVQTGCAQYNAQGTCIAPLYGNGTSIPAGGCLPLSSQIYFAGTGQFLGNVLAIGAVPNYGQYGSVGISGSPVSTVGGTTYSSPSGLQINVASSGGTQATVSGVLQLSQAAQYNIQMTTQGYNPYSYYSGASSSFYGSTPYSSTCVSGLAFQLAPYTSVNGVYGYAYLYLNGTQHGYILQLY
jgi:hypothetical protein